MTTPSRHDEFMQLFLREQWRIYAYIRALVPNRADSEELLQEVAAVLWTKFDQFTPGTRFDRWAYSVAHHKVLNFNAQKRHGTVLFDGDLLTILAEQAADQAERISARRDALDVCLEKLTPEQRALLQLRFEPGATNRSVAKTAGKTESTVSRRLTALYDALLDCIQNRLRAEVRGETL